MKIAKSRDDTEAVDTINKIISTLNETKDINNKFIHDLRNKFDKN